MSQTHCRASNWENTLTRFRPQYPHPITARSRLIVFSVWEKPACKGRIGDWESGIADSSWTCADGREEGGGSSPIRPDGGAGKRQFASVSFSCSIPLAPSPKARAATPFSWVTRVPIKQTHRWFDLRFIARGLSAPTDRRGRSPPGAERAIFSCDSTRICGLFRKVGPGVRGEVQCKHTL